MAGGRTPLALGDRGRGRHRSHGSPARAAVEPCSTIATGRSAATPAASAAAQMSGRADTAMR